MRLFRMADGRYLAQTQYGEWQAKQAGFSWNPQQKVWQTLDPQKAECLAEAVGLVYEDYATAKPLRQSGDHFPGINAGRYAVIDPKDQVLKFYQVDKPTEGKWAGCTFLKVFASDNRWPIKDQETKARILGEIGKAPYEAMARYGKELGICGCCGRTLTDAESRYVGIGPVCRGKVKAA